MSDGDDRAALRDAVLSFVHPTTLRGEHRRLMDEHHRTIEWERSTAHTLPPVLRDELAKLWRARMVAEHRSIGLFALYTQDLLAAGAPAEVLSLACRAALDEVRHTELFGRLAGAYSGHDETPPPGIAPMPEDLSVPLRHQVAREALYLSACAETYSMVSLTAQRTRAADPVVRQVYAAVIADELYHARMGWAFLASLLQAPDPGDVAALRDFLQRELEGMFTHFVTTMFGDPPTLVRPSFSEADVLTLKAHGYVPAPDEWACFQATLRDVWTPGFAALGLDASGLGWREDGGRLHAI